ncbi:MAG: DUF3108 domain-containing protein [Betaproteobacteria bacterium]|nr:DUF3108 domain-containing protein [Betaproteobacteria bacterium]
MALPWAVLTQANASTPSEITATYRIHKGGVAIGTVEEKFIRSGDSYRVSSDTRATGALSLFMRDRITVTAEGKVGEAGLMPTQYQFRRQNNADKNISAQFDWKVGQIISEHDQKTEKFALPRGTIDRISAMYQFMFVEPRTDTLTAWVSGGKRAEEYVYRKRGEPTIRIGDASIETVHYERDNEPGRAKAQVWLSKNQHFLPVRVIFEDSHGLTLEQTLVSLQIK